MTEAWLNFMIVVLVQFLFFIACAIHEKRLRSAPRTLVLGILIGTPFGILFDLILGKFLGLHSYVLGFGASFLVLNAVISYGLFTANVLLLQRLRLLQFYFVTVLIMAVYETTNHFFHVWTWELGLPFVHFLVVLSVGYFGGAFLIAMIGQRFFGYRFHFLPNTLHKAML